MGYFPNGSDGADYQHRYCADCVHYAEDDPVCPVWELHLIHNYDRAKAPLLDALIPRNPDSRHNERCLMFATPKE